MMIRKMAVQWLTFLLFSIDSYIHVMSQISVSFQCKALNRGFTGYENIWFQFKRNVKERVFGGGSYAAFLTDVILFVMLYSIRIWLLQISVKLHTLYDSIFINIMKIYIGIYGTRMSVAQHLFYDKTLG